MAAILQEGQLSYEGYKESQSKIKNKGNLNRQWRHPSALG